MMSEVETADPEPALCHSRSSKLCNNAIKVQGGILSYFHNPCSFRTESRHNPDNHNIHNNFYLKARRFGVWILACPCVSPAIACELYQLLIKLTFSCRKMWVCYCVLCFFFVQLTSNCSITFSIMSDITWSDTCRWMKVWPTQRI